MGVSNHASECICQSCSCGRHKSFCKPTTHVETHMDSETEYRNNFFKYNQSPSTKCNPPPQQLKVGGEFYGNTENHDQYHPHVMPKIYQHPKAVYEPNTNKMNTCSEYDSKFPKYNQGPVSKGIPPPQQLKVGGEFYGSTENHDQYHKHSIPTLYQHPKAVYEPNSAKLDGSTTQRTDYPSWAGTVVTTNRPKTVYNGSTGKFESMTTNKHDYPNYGPQPVYVHPTTLYVKNDAKFEGISSNKAEYQNLGTYSKPARRQMGQHKVVKDDRDFKTANASDFIAYAISAHLVKPAPHQLPRDQKFDGVTTQKHDYQAWDVKVREKRKTNTYVVNPNRMDGHSTYKDSFSSKPIEKIVSCVPNYQPLVSGKFEGVSTQSSDYKSYGIVKKREDCKPRSKLENNNDDRDFMSTMKQNYNVKPLPRCAAEDMIAKGVVGKEGHMVLKTDLTA